MLVLAAVEGHKRCQHLAVGRFGNAAIAATASATASALALFPSPPEWRRRQGFPCCRRGRAGPAARQGNRRGSCRHGHRRRGRWRSGQARQRLGCRMAISCAIMPPIDWPARTTCPVPARRARRRACRRVSQIHLKAAPSAIARHVPGSTRRPGPASPSICAAKLVASPPMP